MRTHSLTLRGSLPNARSPLLLANKKFGNLFVQSTRSEVRSVCEGHNGETLHVSTNFDTPNHGDLILFLQLPLGRGQFGSGRESSCSGIQAVLCPAVSNRTPGKKKMLTTFDSTQT